MSPRETTSAIEVRGPAVGWCVAFAAVGYVWSKARYERRSVRGS